MMDDSTFKMCQHHNGEMCSVESVRREIDDGDIQQVQQRIDQIMPKASGSMVKSAVCLYTNTPDGHFIVDLHPECSAVTVISACSGHGFKFASVIGEIAADLAILGKTKWDLNLFAIDRFDSISR